MTRWALIFLTLIFSLLGCGEKDIEPSAARERQHAFVTEFSEVIGVPAGAPRNLENALIMTDFVFKRTKLQNSPLDFYEYGPAGNLERILSGEIGHICQGLAITLSDVLTAYGYAARTVGLFSDGPDNHVVTEVIIDGRWVLLDPSFNAYFVGDDGHALGVSEMPAGSLRYVDKVPGRTVEEYYFPYERLFHGVEYRDMGWRWD